MYISLLVLFSFLFGYVSNEAQSLYEDNDPMVQFTNNTILEHLSGTKELWVVEFYSSWCGHCQVYAPKWRRLAYELKGWKKYLNVGVMNCAAEKNLDTCTKFKVDTYPSIRFFEPGWKLPDGPAAKKKENWGDMYKGQANLKDVRRSIVDRIENLNEPGYPKPNFDLLTQETINEYKRNARRGDSTYKYLALIFEEDFSYTGKILTLDSDGCAKVAIRRVAHANTMLTSEYNVVAFPALVVIDLATNDARELSKNDRSHEGFVKSLNEITQIIELPPASKEDNTIVDELKREKLSKISSDVFMMDLLSAIAFTLRREIPKIGDEIQDKAYDAMKDWVNLLAKCFPGEKQTKLYLTQLDTWLQRRSENKIKSSDFLTFLETNTDHDAYLPSKIEYRGCEGSETKYRGFPCTLWILFHTLTVNCNENNGFSDGIEVLKRIRNFIDFFFGCRYCRDHFVEMAKNVEQEVKTHDEAILWLWQRHNRVNARLKKSKSSDPVFPKIQFPEDHMCEECRKPTSLANTIHTNPGYDVEATKWNQRVMLEFLKEHYGVDNIRIKEKLKPSNITNEDNDSKTAVRRKFDYVFYSKSQPPSSFSMIGLNQLDMSMCLVLYMSVISVVIALYIYFIKRRGRIVNKFKYNV